MADANGGTADAATAAPVAAPVLLSASDRAPQLQLDASRLLATSRKGYRSVRAAHGFTVGPVPPAEGKAEVAAEEKKGGGGDADEAPSSTDAPAAPIAGHGSGTFYWEAELSHLGATGHARLGWSTRASDVGGPVGYDAHGYGFRDITGEGVHCGWRRAVGGGTLGGTSGSGASPFKEGDVVGLLLHAPAVAAEGGAGPSTSAAALKKSSEAAAEAKEEDAADANAAGNDADDDEAAAAGAAEAAAAQDLPPPIPGSFVGFCVNGVWQGRAYEGRIRPGTYYPTVSLYTLPQQSEGASVRANFGPAFRFPPPTAEALGLSGGSGDGEEVVVRPVCELAAVAAAVTAAAEAAAAKEEEKEEGKEEGDKMVEG
jgi:Set1/Ash2 histone methyltransferase complex subunit ASH2